MVHLLSLHQLDPVPLLELVSNLQSKVARLQDTELEVKQLRDTLQEYNEEFRQVRNQGKVHVLSVIFFFKFLPAAPARTSVKEET
jgi:hypothetical protein